MPQRENRGHSLEVLPDLHPFEVDQISKGDNRCDKYAALWRDGMTCMRDDMCINRHRNLVEMKPPAIFYYDGRAYNQLSEAEYLRDPCRYYRNIYPWKPTGPRAFIPAHGHYKGLGKPPVRQYFKLTPKRVQETRVMPSYEILDPRRANFYFRDSV